MNRAESVGKPSARFPVAAPAARRGAPIGGTIVGLVTRCYMLLWGNKKNHIQSFLQSVCRSRRVSSVKMSESLVVCDVDEALVEKLKAFRFRKATNNAAIIMKIDKDKQLVILEEELEDISLDDLRDELPERQPRFVVYSYQHHHDDGRVSYPLCFIFSSPCDCKPEQQMMYAGSKNRLVKTLNLSKVFEVRTTEELSEEWLKDKLSLFS